MYKERDLILQVILGGKRVYVNVLYKALYRKGSASRISCVVGHRAQALAAQQNKSETDARHVLYAEGGRDHSF